MNDDRESAIRMAILLANSRKAQLDQLRKTVKERLRRLKGPAALEELRELFDLLVFADLDAVKLEEGIGLPFGFAEFDARFLRSLRDQRLGNGEQAKPLTKAQLLSVKSVMGRDHYATQLALLGEDTEQRRRILESDD